MPRASQRSSALRALPRLAAEVRELGGALGRVIVRLEGRPALEGVEKLRRLAKARRAGDSDAAAGLAAAVAALSASDAFTQAMAFTLYFELVNLAEENFRVALLRGRRAASLRPGGGGAPIRESIEAAIAELRRRGLPPARMRALLDRLDIELVFTAHPTESKRRTLLAKLRRLAEILRARAHPEASADPAAILDDGVEREIVSLWLTDRSRTERPDVLDEARTGLWYFDTTLFEAVPRLHADLARALARHYPEVAPPRRWLRFGSWIGGDRDGNPNVSARVTAEVLVMHRRLALEKARLAAAGLSPLLSISDRRDAAAAELARKLLTG
ncbi:MAG: phosphoenolpyruvate carboxylase, partial [Opitutaceae bacterium]